MSGSQSLQLLSLPADILILLPDYLHNIEDFTNLTSSCRALRNCLSRTSPRTILRLAAAASRFFFRPSPHFLIAATARQLSAWAALSHSNTLELRKAFQGGIDALMDLCLDHSGLTLERIRELHSLRFSTINPVTDLIDKSVGDQWTATPDFWSGGVDDAYTINSDPPEAFFHLAIYGELFGHAFDSYFTSGTIPMGADLDTRLEYVKYCMPDWRCIHHQPKPAIDPRRAVLAIGPYLPKPGELQDVYPWTEYQHHLSLEHLLESTRWDLPWAELRESVGGDFEELDEERDRRWRRWTGPEWKRHLWTSAMVYQGFEGLKLIGTD
ncbi:hypothetical protein BU16DRAFT_529517, partial [Lophium mytilinum]